MNIVDFNIFEQEARAAGYDEALQRQWAPDTVVGLHSHAFDAHVVLIHGEMWLTCEGATRHFLPGGSFRLGRDAQHSEQYGSAGATVWVARRTALRG